MSSRVIAANTAATYIRWLISSGLALFSSRWILQGLGASDYGLFNLVGAMTVAMTFFSGVMAAASARFFSFSIGRGDDQEVRQWFNTALGIHFLLAAIMACSTWFASDFIVRGVLNVPWVRTDTVVTVFRASSLCASVGIIAVPFTAAFTANQKLADLAMLATIQAAALAALAYAVRTGVHGGDALLVFGVASTIVLGLTHAVTILLALFRFRECRIEPFFRCSFRRVNELLRFSAASMFGTLGLVTRDQGSAVLVNIHFGAQVNAAHAVAMQVSNAANQLTSALVNAFSPEITRSEGERRSERALALAGMVNRYGTLMVLIAAIPILVETDLLLRIWLGEPPRYAGAFCKAVLVTALIDKVSSGFSLVVAARGKIGIYSLTFGGVLLATLPLAWLFVCLAASPIYIYYAFVATMLVCSAGRVIWAKCLIGVGLKSWFHTTLLPTSVVGGAAIAASLIVQHFMAESIVRLACVALASLATIGLSYWFFLSNDERVFVLDLVPFARRASRLAENPRSSH